MIKCNLAVLLAERGLKMADVINDTSLSKTAVRGLYYNESKGIQYETLEILCDYLNVGPEDLIKKIEFSDKLLERNINKETKIIDYLVAFKLDIKKSKHVIRIRLQKIVHPNDKNSKELHGVYLEFIFDNEFKQNIFSQITLTERLKFEHKLAYDFMTSLNLQNHLLREIHYIDGYKF